MYCAVAHGIPSFKELVLYCVVADGLRGVKLLVLYCFAAYRIPIVKQSLIMLMYVGVGSRSKSTQLFGTFITANQLEAQKPLSDKVVGVSGSKWSQTN